MKKTIIALMALAGVTMGEDSFTSWDLQVYTGTSASDVLTTGNADFYFDSSNALSTYAFDFTATTLKPYGTTTNSTGYAYSLFNTSRVFSYSEDTGNVTSKDKRGGLGVGANQSDGTTSNLTVAITKGTTQIEGCELLTIKEGDVLTFAYDAMSGTVLLYNQTNKKLIQTTVTDDESYYFESGSNSKSEGASAVFTQGGNHQMTYGKITDLSSLAGNVDAIKAYIIPEPTTATLSLLALAGLAVRRRRASR